MDESRQTYPASELLSQAGRLHAIARRLVRDGHAAEDLVQDTWVAALEIDVARLSSLRDSDGWRAWLAGAARNLSIRRRRRDLERRAIEREVARPEAAGQVEHLAERMQQQQVLADAILALDEPYRSALVMRYLDGLEHEEIAARQQISKANARKRVSRALSMLRARLAPQGAEFKSAWSIVLGFFGAGKSVGTEGALSTPLALSPAGVGGVLVGVKSWIGIALVLGASAALVATFLQESPAQPPAPALTIENTAPDDSALASHAEARELGPQDSFSTGHGERSAITTKAASASESWTGVVTNSTDHPIESVLIRPCDSSGKFVFELDEDPKVQSAADGSFTVARTKKATQLSFEAPTYLTQVVSVSTSEPTNVELLACPRVRGTVRGAGGNFVAPPGIVTLSVRQALGDESTDHNAQIESDGSFLFDDLPVGTLHHLASRAKGFAPLEQMRDERLEAEASLTIDIELPKGLTVVGVVRDAETRQPIPFARVWSKNFNYDEASDKPTAIADAQGRYRLEGVEPEERVFGEQRMYLLWIVGDSDGYAPSPWNPKLARADDEGVCERDLDLAPRSCSLIVVLLEPVSKEPARGVFVWFVDAEKNFRMQISNQLGEVAFEKIPAGNLGFVAYRNERGKDGLYSSLTFERNIVAGSHERLELELRADRGTDIEGQVLDAEGVPIAQAELVARYDLRVNGLALPLTEESQLTDQDGRYRFSDMRVGHYRIEPAVCSFPRDQHLDLVANERQNGVNFVQGECMTISGSVELSEAKSDRYFLKLLNPHTAEVLETAGIRADSTFEFDAILQGTYDLLLLEKIGELEVDRVIVRPEQHSGIVLRVR